MKKSKLLLGTVLGLGLASATAQEVSVDALIRPRFEYRHGFQDVVPEGTDGAAFVSQRSSLLLKYTDEKITTFLDFQSVDVWGDRAQLQRDDNNENGGLRINQAWADVKLGNGFSAKVGRQIINLDDQRIFGGVGWTQQQRTHDAAVLKYKTGGFKAQLGFGFNQNGPGNFDSEFTASGAGVGLFQYKGLQYLHLNNKFSDSFSGSFLFTSNQFQDVIVEGVSDGSGNSSRQTTGIHGKYKQGKFGLDFSGYYQFGEIQNGTSGVTSDISAWNAAVNATYKVGTTVLGLGAEALSGNDSDTVQQDAFFPLFGTNHKFNGYQDFFFVGRHANNGGLLDINAKAIFKLAPKSKLITAAHLFSGLEDAPTNGVLVDSGYYGTAVDLVFVQKINKYSNIKVGYSQTFFDDDFADARANGDADDIQNWGWVQLTIKPNLFKWKKPAETK